MRSIVVAPSQVMVKGERYLLIFGGWAYPRSVFLNDTHLLKLEGCNFTGNLPLRQ